MWTVVIVRVGSVSVRVPTGEWKLRGENHAMCLIFCFTNGKWNDSSLNKSICYDCLRHDMANVGNCVVWAIGNVFISIDCFSNTTKQCEVTVHLGKIFCVKS